MRRHENSTKVTYNTTFFVTLFEELENIVKMMQVMKKQVHKTQINTKQKLQGKNNQIILQHCRPLS